MIRAIDRDSQEKYRITMILTLEKDFGTFILSELSAFLT